MLKTPHILATGHGEIQLVLTGKLPPCWLGFTVLESDSKGESQQQYYLVMNYTSFNNDNAWQDRPMGAVVALMLLGYPTTFCLDFRLAPQQKAHAWDINLASMSGGGHKP